LQHEGIIHYRRGHITVIDRAGLEERACECYQTVKTEFDRLLPIQLPRTSLRRLVYNIQHPPGWSDLVGRSSPPARVLTLPRTP